MKYVFSFVIFYLSLFMMVSQGDQFDEPYTLRIGGSGSAANSSNMRAPNTHTRCMGGARLPTDPQYALDQGRFHDCDPKHYEFEKSIKDKFRPNTAAECVLGVAPNTSNAVITKALLNCTLGVAPNAGKVDAGPVRQGIGAGGTEESRGR